MKLSELVYSRWFRWTAIPVLVATIACAGLVSRRLKAHEAVSAPVRMAYLQGDLHHLPLWVAIEEGFFTQEGLNVSVVGVFHAGAEIVTAFDAGALDAAYVGEAPVTIAAARHGVACIRVLNQSNTEGSALVLSAEVNSTKRDLTLALPGHGSVQDLLLTKALQLPDLKNVKVNKVILSPPEMLTAMSTRQIDGFLAWEPYPSRAVSMGIGRIAATSANIWPGHPCCTLVVSSDFLNHHRDQAGALSRAHARAVVFIREHPDEAVTIAIKYTGMNETDVKRALPGIKYAIEPSVKGEQEFVQFLNMIGYTSVADPDALTRDLLVSPKDGIQ